MDQRTPNLFIIGAPKAGTTFVHHALALDDQVYMSEVKEPGFFTNSRDYIRGLEYYLNAYFARAGGRAVRGESTPWYLYSAMARRRIADVAFAEEPRFLVLVRRPSTRALSMFRDQVRTNRERRTFEQAVDDELALLQTDELHPDVRKRYVWCGLYAEHIERWRADYGEDNVHVAVFEDLLSEPEAVWTELGAFLGAPLGPSRFDDVSERDRNPRGRLRWPRLDAGIRSLEGRDNPVLEGVKRALPPGLHRRVLQRIGRLNRNPEPLVDEAMNDELQERIDHSCQADTQRLEKIIGRSLGWSADTGIPPRLSPP